ncbi:MAG TPA: twin-arginine translocation signal domain-containing protein [Longimicrobiales bacterium]|nr:twin-arginine translocation signal domain-containing protein [Longimicrobiales bacterium]
MSKTEKRSTEPGVGTSRRDFVKRAAMGAGATAALGSSGVRIAAQEAPESITIPAEFEAAKAASLPAVDFPMTGAQVFARACHEEGVKALFCCPGNYDVNYIRSLAR